MPYKALRKLVEARNNQSSVFIHAAYFSVLESFLQKINSIFIPRVINALLAYIARGIFFIATIPQQYSARILQGRKTNMSNNHQFIAFNDRVVKRYVKTVLYRVSGYRIDPYRPENQLTFLLITPERDLKFVPQENARPKIERMNFSYDDEVLELYSDSEVRIFERLNRATIEAGLLKEYKEETPAINTENMLDDEEIEEIAGIRQLPALRKRLSTITSVITLGRIQNAAHDLNRSVSIIKAVEDRINELSTENTK